MADQDCQFYGTTGGGGTSNEGTVFRMTPTGTLTTLHAFTDSPDGANPRAPLIQDRSGYLYGTTQAGGTSHYGTIFRITL